MFKFFTLCLLCIGLIACQEETAKAPQAASTQADTHSKNQQEDWLQANIKYLNFEGGFWGIETHTGDKLLPMNLPKEYQQNNLEVLLQGKKLEGMMTIHQWGTPFEIAEIKSVDKANK